MARHKKIKMTELEKFIGSELSEDTALIGAAETLAQASKIATKKKDVDSLINAVEGWLTLSRFLSEEKDFDKSSKYGMIGFTSSQGDSNEPKGNNNG